MPPTTFDAGVGAHHLQARPVVGAPPLLLLHRRPQALRLRNRMVGIGEGMTAPDTGDRGEDARGLTHVHA